MLNKMILQGRLVRDPEMTMTSSGVNLAKVTIAWSSKYKDTETKCFLPCIAWRNTADFISNYFTKGQECIVEGKLQTRDYEANDGTKRYVTELVIDSINFCGSKAAGSSTVDNDHDWHEEDLPF
jgi:single-strand DNA-binding protein